VKARLEIRYNEKGGDEGAFLNSMVYRCKIRKIDFYVVEIFRGEEDEFLVTR